MDEQRDIERMLTNVPKPHLKDGVHRGRLRGELLMQMRRERASAQTGAMIMTQWKRRLAWACLLVLLGAGATWAAQRVVRTFVVQDVEPHDVIVSGKDGPVTFMTSSHTLLSSDDPEFTEQRAREQHEEIQQLIARGEYELVGTSQTELGMPVYSYRFALSDGTEHTVNRGRPLDCARDQKDVLQEIQDQVDRKMGELTTIGRFDYGKYYGYRFTLSDGLVTSLGRDTPYLGTEDEVFEEVDVLIAAGEGELVRSPSEVSDQYCYRLTLSDGRVIHYLCDSPLR